MADVNAVKAGKYELLALQWDERTSKVGEPFDFIRHYRGDVVTLNVEEARRLVAAGAVGEPGAQQKAVAEAARLAYEAALAALPAELVELADASQVEPVESTVPAVDADAELHTPEALASATEAPPQQAAKPLWVQWAVAQGADRATAEDMSKRELIAEYALV